MKRKVIIGVIIILTIITIVFIKNNKIEISDTLLSSIIKNRSEGNVALEIDVSVNGDGSVIAKMSEEEKALTISGNGKMLDFDNNDNRAPWRSYSSQIETLKIEEGVQNIGAYSFIYCAQLRNVYLADSITEIGRNAFEQCIRIPEIQLPSNIKKIDTYAFTKCRQLTNLNLGNTEEIETKAFSICNKLETVTISDKTVNLAEGIFTECTELKSITVDLQNPNYSSIDGVLFNKNKTVILYYPPKKIDSSSYIIPETVTKIGEGAFQNCSTITELELPSGITEIESWAFDGCSGLSTINIPEGVSVIKEGTFRKCLGLTKLEIPSTISEFDGSFIFNGCANLGEITINGEIKKLGVSEFINCNKLEKLTITENAQKVNDLIFQSIGTLKKIEVNSNNKYLKTDENGEILYDYELTKVIGCIQLKEGNVVLPKTVTQIQSGAFQKCKLITSIEMPSSITMIGSSAFNNFNGIIYLPQNVNLGSNNGIGEDKIIYCHSSTAGFSAIRREDNNAPIVTIDKNNGLKISATDDGCGLSSYNEYEYYISTKKNSLVGGRWIKYNLGENINITENEGDTYVFVKTISDKIGNTNNMGTVEIDGNQYYQVLGIDGTAPTYEIQKIVAEDKNSCTIIITTNEEVKDIKRWTLSDDGRTLSKTYTENKTEDITLEDLSGNKTVVSISVTEIEEIFESEKYEIDTNKKEILNIQPSTTFESFAKNIISNQQYIIKENDENITNTETIKTGQKLIINENTYTLVVTGDATGDGKADIYDILKINKHRLKKVELLDCYLEASDVDKNKTVDIHDILKINKYRLRKIYSF